ncbi:MAG TPA: phage tail tape measure protein, partial [Longimicrobiales bacterium]
MGINAAQLMVTVGANTAAAEQGVMGFSRLIGMGGPLALGAVGAAAVLAGVGIASIKMAGDFQSGMTTIVTGAGESTKNLGMLSQGVLDMAMATGTSTKQLTDGLYMIESGGFRGAAALNILRAAAEGAKVGNADLGVVADATDTVLKNYGQHGLSAAQAVNALIDTVSHGKTHMEDLAAALAHILPTAAAAHVSLGDVLGAMATMTGEGVDAANAATYLRQMLIALEAPSDKSKKVLDGLGLSTQTLAAEMQLSLPRALQDITDRLMHEFPQGAYVASVEMDKVKAGTESWDTALAHMSKSGASQYVAAIRDLSGGMRQMQGMLLLTGPHLKTFNDLSALIGATAGKSGDAIAGWALVQKNFNQQFAVFGETVKVLLIELGQHLLPAAGEFVSLLTGGLKSGVGDLTGQLSALTGEGLAPADVHARHLHGAVTLLHSSVHTQLNPTLAKLNEYMQSELVPIFTKYGGQMEREMVPIMRTFGQVMTQNILPALGPLGKQFAEGFLKPAMKLGADVLPVLNPLLQALGWLFQNVLA